MLLFESCMRSSSTSGVAKFEKHSATATSATDGERFEIHEGICIGVVLPAPVQYWEHVACSTTEGAAGTLQSHDDVFHSFFGFKYWLIAPRV